MATGWSATPRSITKRTIQELGICDVVRRTLVGVVVLDDQILHRETPHIERGDLELVEFAARDAQLADAETPDRRWLWCVRGPPFLSSRCTIHSHAVGQVRGFDS
jgi:hypothetical protein